MPPFLSKEAVEPALKEFNLTEGQHNAVLQLFTAEDKITGIQGYAGTGKTTMMRAAKAPADKEGLTIL